LSAPAPPLAGSVVLSVGHTLPGLYCLAALRDLGAEVVRVERARRGGDAGPYASLGVSFPSRSLLAGTSELALDLKHDRGREVFVRLAAGADVVLEGFRPGVAARLGVDYAKLSEAHRALVYASISGYGQQGAWSQRAGHDVNYLAETGVLQLGNPRALPGATFADGLAGISAALNIVAALHAAARSGCGQYLDLAIVDGPLFLMASEIEFLWQTGASRHAGDTHLTGRHPWYNVHETADGGAVAVGAVEPGFHAAWCKALGRPDLAARQHDDGAALSDAWDAARALTRGHTRAEIVERFEAEDACVSPVLDTAEVVASPLMERARRREAGSDEPLVRSPVRVAGASLEPERSGREVLVRFGFGAEEIAELARAGALGDAP
jgi:crotonobetainyl-CoA:carnitine CoA-transferase CaiB-like acyl-CoA transferase